MSKHQVFFEQRDQVKLFAETWSLVQNKSYGVTALCWSRCMQYAITEEKLELEHSWHSKTVGTNVGDIGDVGDVDDVGDVGKLEK